MQCVPSVKRGLSVYYDLGLTGVTYVPLQILVVGLLSHPKQIAQESAWKQLVPVKMFRPLQRSIYSFHTNLKDLN